MSEHRLDRIVIERPRSGMRVSSQKKIRRHIKQQLQQIKYDYQAADIGTLKPCYKTAERGIESKYFSDNLNPLYKWLRSHVGQSWNDVYAKLSRLLEFRTLSGQHILVHVWQFVTRDVVMIGDVPYSLEYSLRRIGSTNWCSRDELYVHPQTGLLCIAKLPPKQLAKPKADYLWLDKYHRYYKLNEIWYLVSFRDVPQPFITVIDRVRKVNPTKVRDILTRKTIIYKELFYGKNNPTYAYHKHQCSKQEIKWIESELTKKAD